MGHAARPAISSITSTTTAAAVRRRLPALAAAAGMVAVLGVAPAGAATQDGAARAAGATPHKTPVAVGYGGAVSSVDADASAAGIDVLR
ncbi:gamma-glutamyltransferase, partial [Streptomyces milbemycinicus]